VLVATVAGSALSARTRQALKGDAGVKTLTSAQGISYHDLVNATSFAAMSEDDTLSLYEQTLQKGMAAGGLVYVFGQIYADATGAHGALLHALASVSCEG